MVKSAKKSPPLPLVKVRQNLKQTDVPSYRLDEALKVPRAILENYGGKPVTPLELAQALQVLPSTGPFRMLCGASIAYGLTEGGYNAKEIKVQPLAFKILRPQKEDEDLAAKREALLTPRVVGEFLRKYDTNPIPREDIASNVLNAMGVPLERTQEAFDLIIESAQALGLVTEIKGRKFVALKGAGIQPDTDQSPDLIPPDGQEDEQKREDDKGAPSAQPKPRPLTGVDEFKRRRVYITHGTNKSFVEPIKMLLKYGELEAVVSTERESVAQPVPDKVMEDMRGCGAAIIHIDAEQKLIDTDAHEHIVLNPNVLIEIGAAMALYGRRYIFLVRAGVRLPSNLQGLYEVRYSGETLSGEDTIKLIAAINDMKSRPFPAETPAAK